MSEPINKTGEIEIGVAVDAQAVDEAIEKVGALGEATSDLAPLVSIRASRGCTFNIYVSRNTWRETGVDD